VNITVKLKGKIAGLKPVRKTVFTVIVKNVHFQMPPGKIKLVVPGECSLISV